MKVLSVLGRFLRSLSFSSGVVGLAVAACADPESGSGRPPGNPYVEARVDSVVLDSTDSSSAPSRAAIGEACNTTSACGEGPAPVCLEPDFEWLNGYCSSACQSHADCGDNGGCVSFSDGTAACLALCNFDTDCRAGFTCYDLDGPGYCVPDAVATRWGYADACADLGFEGVCYENRNIFWCDENGEIHEESCSNGCGWDDVYGWVCR